MRCLREGYKDRYIGFYFVLLRFLIVEDYIEFLHHQYALHVYHEGISFHDSEQMGTDEFELICMIMREKQKIAEASNRRSY